jgi:hypothetical protein
MCIVDKYDRWMASADWANSHGAEREHRSDRFFAAAFHLLPAFARAVTEQVGTKLALSQHQLEKSQKET